MNVGTSCSLNMDQCRCSALSSLNPASSFGDHWFMAKRYVAYPVKRQDRAGNIVRGFIIGLAEFGSFGTRLFDLAGYPHESEEDAIRASWEAIGADMWKAAEEFEQQQSDDRRGQSPSAEKGTEKE